ncbi:MAG: AMP-binding protein, partial [Paracoccaceae bacterium]
MNLATWLVRAACEFQSKDALYLGVDPVARYDQFGHWATSGASWLRSRGIQAGDRVAIYMPNTPDYLALFYAIWHLGAVAVPVNAKLHAKEAAWVFENAGARLAFVGKNAAQELEQSLGPNSQTEILVLPKVGFGGIAHGFDPSPVASRDADDLAWLFYTSGTTGRPKGVEITHGMMQSMALSYFVDVD